MDSVGSVTQETKTPQVGSSGSAPSQGGVRRVMLITATLDVGGTERQLVALASRLNRERFAPRVCCLDRPGPLGVPLAAAGVPVDVVTLRGLSPARDPVRTGWSFLQLVALLRRHRPALVHTFLRHANALGALAARLARIPVVVASARSLDPELPVWGWLAMRLADLVLTNAEAVRRHTLAAQGLPAAKVRVIRNGVSFDPRRQVGAPRPPDLPGGRLIVTVANPNPFKVEGLLVLARAAEHVLALVPDARFLVVGDGAERGRVETATCHLGDRFRCLGSRQDVPAILEAAKVAVLPSLREGLPNAILEAMAAGRPVVATGVGGIPEAVVHGETGLLVPPADSGGLAEAILALLGDPARAEAMGRAGRDRVAKEFGLDRMIRETEALYEELLASKAIARTR